MPDTEGFSAHQAPAYALLTIAEAALLLRIGQSTIRNAIRAGQLRAFRFGTRRGTIRISADDLDEYAAASATEPAKAAKTRPALSAAPFKCLNAGRLLAAWRQQGVLGVPPDDNNAPSSESNGVPSTPRES